MGLAGLGIYYVWRITRLDFTDINFYSFFMITWLIIVLIWIIGTFASHKLIMSKWDVPVWESWMLSLAWPCVFILYGIHLLHMSTR